MPRSAACVRALENSTESLHDQLGEFGLADV
jgi:hypothetical protein